MKTILILGSAGKIGKSIYERFSKSNKIFSLDKNKSKKINFHYNFINGKGSLESLSQINFDLSC